MEAVKIQTFPNQATVQANGQTVAVPTGQAPVNFYIQNPMVIPPGSNINMPQYHYGQGYYTGQMGAGAYAEGGGARNINETTTKNINETAPEKKKTEKRKIVELTDDYIKNLENYLNSQDKEVRMMGAKEVVARLQEDDTRANDKALNALVNKMLQDPSSQIRLLALSMLDSRLAIGDNTSIQLLTNMTNSPDAYGQDAPLATQILLKMSGKLVEKEFPVKEKPEKKKDKE
jgi:hypothetical protein